MNRDRLDEILARNGLYAVVATAPENLRWAIDYGSFQGVWNRTTRMLLIPRSDVAGEMVLIVPIAEVAWVVDSGSRIDLRVFGKQNVLVGDVELGDDERRIADLMEARASDPAACLAAALDDVGVPAGPVAVDGLAAPGLVDLLQAQVPSYEFVGGGDALLRWARMVKSPSQVEALRTAASVNEAGIQAMLRLLGHATDHELADVHRSVIQARGGHVQHWLGGAGRAAGAYRPPSGQIPERGSRWRYDAGIIVGGWCSDLGGTAHVGGQPSKQERTTYAAITAGIETGLASASAGTPTSQVYREMIAAVRRSGLTDYRYSLTGHGIGVEPRDWPIVSEASRSPSPFLPDPFDPVLHEGMVLNLEVPVAELGSGGFQHEVTAVVGRNGATLISPLRSYEILG